MRQFRFSQVKVLFLTIFAWRRPAGVRGIMNTTKSTLTAILLVAASLSASAETETRDLEGFNAITVGGGIDLHVEQGDTFLVEVVSPTDDADDVITEIR